MQNSRFPIATPTPPCCSSCNVMYILRQTAILWDNIFGLKSSCRISCALVPLPKTHLSLFFLFEFTDIIFPTVFSLWCWINNLDIKPQRHLDLFAAHCWMVTEVTIEIKNYFVCTSYQQIYTTHILKTKRKTVFYQIHARLIQSSCNWGTRDLLSLFVEEGYSSGVPFCGFPPAPGGTFLGPDPRCSLHLISQLAPVLCEWHLLH